MTETTIPPFSVELEATSMGGLPEPVEFTRLFKLGIEREYAARRAELAGSADGRVDVTDTHALHRTLAKGFELAKGYKAAFEAGRKLFGELQTELLVDGVGEQDGVPNSGLTIPDAEGDIKLTVTDAPVHTIDLEALKATVAATVIGRDVDSTDGPVGSLTTFVRDLVNGDTAEDPARLGEILAEAIMHGMDQLLTCGSFEPQVSKVRAFAAQVQRDGDDHLGAQVLDTITTRRELKGVTMTRKTTPRTRR